jgi:hypothetical protein
MINSEKNVIILGCGPAGLMAAWAAVQSGKVPLIFSHKIKSRQYGAQWLHRSIPGLTKSKPDGQIEYQFEGEKQGYAQKVYGDGDQDVSWGKFGEEQNIWNLRDVYSILWERLNEYVIHANLSPEFLRNLQNDSETANVPIVSTVPRTILCAVPSIHQFTARPIWAGVTNRFTHPVTPDLGSKNRVVYNGSEASAWYRCAWVFGKGTVEYPATAGIDPPDVKGLFYVNKPIATDCDCFEDSVAFVGRYGRWEKEELSHDAFYRTQKMIREYMT